MLRNKKARLLVVGLGISFVIFSVAFTYHIHTHPYYHIQLFPIVGLCLAPIVVDMTKLLMQSTGKTWWIPIFVASLLAFYFGYREVRESLYRGVRMENPVAAWEIGEMIHHSPRTVFVAFYYGVPLEYYGEFGGAPWPVRIEDEFYKHPDDRELSIQERIEGLGFVPEYYVITHFDLYNRKHQDLRTYLENNCSVLAETNAYLIYTNCTGMAVK